jgi:hypothetical protein
LACAERSDGAADVQVLFETALPIDPDNFDEDAMREMFLDVPSGRKALGFPSVSSQPKTRIHKDKRWQLLRISAKRPLYKGSFERLVG